MSRIAIALLLLLPLVASGCFGKDAPPAEDPALGSSESVSGAEPAGAADDTTVAAADAADDAANGTSPAPAAREVAVAESGELGAGAEVCRSEGTSITCVATGTTRWGVDLALDGATASAYTLTLSWEAATPASASLAFTIVACDAADECQVVHLTGPSPLTHQASMVSDTRISVYVSPSPQGAAGVGAYLSTPQRFSLDGTLVLMDAPPA